jgi:hypothetical protein
MFLLMEVCYLFYIANTGCGKRWMLLAAQLAVAKRQPHVNLWPLLA